MRKQKLFIKLAGGEGSDPLYMEVSGVIDIMSVDLFKIVFASFIRLHLKRIRQGADLLVDMLEVHELGCLGIGALMVGHNLISGIAPGQRVHVIANENAMSLLETCGTHEVLHIHPSMAAAMSAIADS